MFDRLYRHGRLIGIGLAAALINACGGGGASSPETEPFFVEEEAEWALVWSDEFDGSTVNTANWSFQEGDGSDIFGQPGWGNFERQYYQADNATVADGLLTITARSEEVGGMPYTSTRMRSLNKFDFKYGRVEVRASAAPGQGLWSAVWMLPSDATYGASWAASGEADILEVVNAGTDNQAVFAAAHFGFEWPLNRIYSGLIEVDDASEMHTYAIEWSQEYIRWFLDGEHLYTMGADHYYSYFYQNESEGFATEKGGAPLNVPFHLLVNLAVGGNGPGDVDPGAIPSEMVVDYIRVYQCQYGTEGGTGCNSNADRTLEQPDALNPYVYETELYNDGAATLSWTIAGELIERPLQAVTGWDNNGAMVVTEAVVEGRGSVIDISTTGAGNAVINAVDGGILDIYGHYGGGELKFDMYIDSSGTAPLGSLAIKMDSGWPALGYVTFDIADLPSNEWFTRSVKVSDFIENAGDQPLEIGATINAMVVEPSSAAHIMVDNVKLVCGHPERNGCGIAPPVADTGGELLTVLGTDGVVNTALFDKGDGATQGICGSSGDTSWVDYCGDTGASAGNLISWSLSDSGDPDVGTSVLVNFGPGADSGVWFFGSTAGVDLTAFRDEGFLRFDLRLPQVTVDTGMVWKLDCFFPCSTGDQVLDLTGYVADTWQTFEFPVSEIAAMGDFDLTRANTGLVLFPTFGEQNNLSFEVANVRYEVDGDDTGGGEPEDTGILGTWQLAKTAGALQVGPGERDGSWWQNSEGDVTARACLFDDNFVFSRDGTFAVEMGGSTWLEGWQGVDEGCGTPIAPHDGSIPATFTFDEDQQSLTIDGQGSFIGLAKAYNGCEIGKDGCAAQIPGDAPASITYNAYENEDGTATFTIEIGGGYWSFTLEKVAEPPAPAPIVGSWQLAPIAGALKVGPGVNDGSWWQNAEGDVTARGCLFDDVITFGADGSVNIEMDGSTWLEGWQGVAEGCGTPIAPHNGENPGTYSYDADAGQVTVQGQGTFIGLAKAYNGCEIGKDGCAAQIPGDAPAEIVYDIELLEDGNAMVSLEIGGGYWTFTLQRAAEPEASPIVGSWQLAPIAGALKVGPNVDDGSWWQNAEGDVTARGCLFDDVITFGADGSATIDMGGSTWLEGWQGVAEGCGTPIAPHDGANPGTYSYDAEVGQVTVQGQGTFIGLAKAYNGCEIGKDGCAAQIPGDAPSEIVYDIELMDDGSAMVSLEIGGGYWTFTLVKI